MDHLLSAAFVLGTLIIISVVGNVFASEVSDGTPSVEAWLIERAVSTLPSCIQARYREEWSAHLNECPRKLSKLVHALGIMRSSYKLAKGISSESKIPVESLDDDIFRDPKKLKLLLSGLILTLIGSLSEFIPLLTADTPLVLKSFVVVSLIAGSCSCYLCAKLLKLGQSGGCTD